ncbi:unnamed protein product [Candidula unifasciata]|uniref:U6 snRNA phosphodiesterase n=1 Tax=Candidula unifasciata TaxID=100452 RepID=A0A8S3ZSH7_9EUPU|nr:unnamed protein product [Candidula unifasciata]
MNRLVSYTSSDDEDNVSGVSPEMGSAMVETNIFRQDTYINTVSQDEMVKLCSSHKPGPLHKVTMSHTPAQDLPITDESDDQKCNFVSSDSDTYSELSHSTKVTLDCHLSKSETERGKDSSSHGSQTINVTSDVQNKVTDNVMQAHQKTNMNSPSTGQGHPQVQTSHTSALTDEADSYKVPDIYSVLSPCSEEDHSFTTSSPESPTSVQPVESETVSCTLTNRKRKLSDGSKKHLDVPNSIQSMFLNKQHRWTDDPSQHDNRVRSFAHLEGNWATHVFVPVAKSEEFVKFVDKLLSMLMPQTFQAQSDFHVSLSRTVTIRYHWIELLVDSLREQFKSLTSCISDLTSVKLFTNDEKTRTFVVIELSVEDNKEFLEYVRAVDKSFAEFKLPAYYENPSFHISVGWCVGDVISDIPGEKLSKAQEMLGDFVAANPDLGFVYVHQICCQTGCKSFLITLPDAGI